jgi:hypothetical protein
MVCLHQLINNKNPPKFMIITIFTHFIKEKTEEILSPKIVGKNYKLIIQNQKNANNYQKHHQSSSLTQ